MHRPTKHRRQRGLECLRTLDVEDAERKTVFARQFAIGRGRGECRLAPV
jgi:hypothetical protein